MFINFNRPGQQPKGILARVLTAILGAVVLGAAFMFSLVFFAVLAVAGLIFWLYFWWKTRALRKQIRDQMQAQGTQAPSSATSGSGDIIEGEAVRVVDERGRLSE